MRVLIAEDHHFPIFYCGDGHRQDDCHSGDRVDGDKDLAEFSKDGLEREGFVVDWAPNGREALALARESAYDVILLDVMMPVLDGFAALKALRAEKNSAAVIMLTSRGAERDKLTGLDGGADDYVVKPCLLTELAARIRAVLRRREPTIHSPGHPTVLEAGDLRLDLLKHRFTS